jgi:hypothetical protein
MLKTFSWVAIFIRRGKTVKTANVFKNPANVFKIHRPT